MTRRIEKTKMAREGMPIRTERKMALGKRVNRKNGPWDGLQTTRLFKVVILVLIPFTSRY